MHLVKDTERHGATPIFKLSFYFLIHGTCQFIKKEEVRIDSAYRGMGGVAIYHYLYLHEVFISSHWVPPYRQEKTNECQTSRCLYTSTTFSTFIIVFIHTCRYWRHQNFPSHKKLPIILFFFYLCANCIWWSWYERWINMRHHYN